MPNAWFHYVFPLAILTIFVIAGVALFRNFIRGERDAQGRPCGPIAGCFGIVLSVVGGALGLGILLSPAPWERQRIFDHIFRTPPERIERFVIQPGHANQYKPLTGSRIVIDDPARIRGIAEILRTSREVSANHPRTKWTATVEMVTLDGTYYFSVDATVPGDCNGTLVTAGDKGRGAWVGGDFCADGLDQVLEGAVDAAGQHAANTSDPRS